MLKITIPKQKYEYVNANNDFIYVDIDETNLKLEHSLISIRKWESKWRKPFLSEKDKSLEELTDYIRCMNLMDDSDSNIYKYIPKDIMSEISSYIENPMTATWFNDSTTIGAQKSSREIVTAEIIYYWMISLSIPVEFEKWHLNQLLTLIKVISIKNGKQEKVDPKVAAQQRAAINAARRAKYHTNG